VLAPHYLPAIPVDPCGGQPLHYAIKAGGSGFLLYSIGPDLKDNGGTPGKTPDEANTDIVAGQMWRKNPILYSGSRQ
jgi:hypothetical protein